MSRKKERVCVGTEQRSKLRAHELPRGFEAIARALEAPWNTPLFSDIHGIIPPSRSQPLIRRVGRPSPSDRTWQRVLLEDMERETATGRQSCSAWGNNFLLGANRRNSLLAVSPVECFGGCFPAGAPLCLGRAMSRLERRLSSLRTWTGLPGRRAAVGTEKAHCGLADEHVKRRIGEVGWGRLSLASKASLSCIVSALSRTKASPFDLSCMPFDNTSILVLGRGGVRTQAGLVNRRQSSRIYIARLAVRGASFNKMLGEDEEGAGEGVRVDDILPSEAVAGGPAKQVRLRNGTPGAQEIDRVVECSEQRLKRRGGPALGLPD